MLFRSNLQNRNTVSSLDSNSEGVHTFNTPLYCVSICECQCHGTSKGDIHTSTKEREAMLGRCRVVRKVTTNAGNLGIRKTYPQADYGTILEKLKYAPAFLLPATGISAYYSSTKLVLQGSSAIEILSEFLPYRIKEAIPYTANYFELLKNEDYISRASIEAEIW